MNKDQDAARAGESRKKYPKRWILIRLRHNAKITDVKFDLRESDIPPFPKYCPVFPWIKLRYEIGKGRTPGSVSVDRINNLKGYISGNIRIISWAANKAKSNLSDRELIALGKDAKKRLDKSARIS